MKYPLIKPAYYKSLFLEISSFVRSPGTVMIPSKSTRMKVYDMIGLFVLKMLMLIPLMIFFGLVYDPKSLTQASMADRFSPPMMLLVGGVILPLVEEVGFRLSLKFKPAFLAMSVGVFAYYILTKGIYHTKISEVDDTFMVRAGASLLVGLGIYLFAHIRHIRIELAAFWQAHFRYIYYTSCVIFAAVHIFKYELIWLNVLLLPLLTLPQLMSGIIYGYVRITFGFQYNLLFHMATNVLAIGLTQLMS